MNEIDLDGLGVAMMTAREVLDDIDKAAIAMHSDGHRKHLGASIIGEACLRKLWLGFRWTFTAKFSGRQMRLFNRGHLEEPRFTGWLKYAGYIVNELDPTTNKQWRVSSVGGHFGGSQDGEIYLPTKFDYSKPLLLEYKTNGTGAGFKKLLEEKVAIAKPMHFDQMSTYGYLKKYSHALYLNVCKNDDHIYSEIVKLDWQRGEELEKKAKVIILSQEAPPRIAQNPASMHCKYCDYSDVCYGKQPSEKNCRSCKYLEPRDNKMWHCNKWSAFPPDEVIAVGCDNWTAIYNAS